MRCRPNFAAAAALLLLWAGPAGAASFGGLPDTIRVIKPSIVGVGTYRDLRRPPAQLHGTGFAVGDGSLVLTNHHVVAQPLSAGHEAWLAVFVGRGSEARAVRVDVAASDADHDIVLLRMRGVRLPPMPLGDDAGVAEGQPIAFTGFPIGAVLGLYPVTHRGIVSARTPSAIPQRRQRSLDTAMIHALRNRFEVFQLDATAYPGNSGSPLYDPDSGAVYGIISSVFVKGSKENVLSKPSGITYAIPIAHARRLLREVAAQD